MLQLPSLEMGSGLQQLSKNNPVDLWCGIGKRYKTCTHLLAVSSHASLERHSTFTSRSLQLLSGPCSHPQHILTASSWCRAHSFSLASQHMQSVSSAFIPLILICSALLVTVACPCGMLTNMPIRVNCSRFLCKCQVGPNLDQSFAESMQCMRACGASEDVVLVQIIMVPQRIRVCPVCVYCARASYAHKQHSAAQHSTAQHSTAQHSTAQHSAAQRSAAQHRSAPRSAHSRAQHSTAQHGMAWHGKGLLSTT